MQCDKGAIISKLVELFYQPHLMCIHIIKFEPHKGFAELVLYVQKGYVLMKTCLRTDCR